MCRDFGVVAPTSTTAGRRAVSASRDKTLKVWDLDSGAELGALQGHGSGVSAVAVTPDGRRAVSASYDQSLKVWDLDRGDELRTLQGHDGGVWAVAATPDGRRAVSASSDQTLKIWDLNSGVCIATFHAEHPALSCACSPMGTIVARDAGGGFTSSASSSSGPSRIRRRAGDRVGATAAARAGR